MCSTLCPLSPVHSLSIWPHTLFSSCDVFIHTAKVPWAYSPPHCRDLALSSSPFMIHCPSSFPWVFSGRSPLCPHLSSLKEHSRGTALQMWLKWKGLPYPAVSPLSCGLQDAVRPLLQKDTATVGSWWLPALQNPQICFCKAAFGQLVPSM